MPSLTNRTVHIRVRNLLLGDGSLELCGLALVPIGLVAAAGGASRREGRGAVLIGAGLSLAALLPLIVAVIVGPHAVATT